MKKLFKKSMTILGSVFLVGATVGVASAASYPAPFDDGAVIVTGSNAAASDGIAASKVDSGLKAHAAKKIKGDKKTLTGDGDKFQFEKSSTKFNLGDAITGVYPSALDEDELEKLLAEGVYEDTNNDEFDYSQKITMNSGLILHMFSDNDYDDQEPTVGFNISSGDHILNYTLDFSDQPAIANMDDTDLMVMGKEYYVLSTASTNDKITLLDSATEISIAEGDTKTVTVGTTTYEVSIDYIGSSKVSLKINGETTKTLAEGATSKLDSGAYVGIKELRYNSKDTGISSVVFSIGNGKLILTDGQDVEINDDSINDLKAYITNSSNDLDNLVISWSADDDMFITEDDEITMPGFEAVKLSFTGIDFTKEEEVEISNDGDSSLVFSNFPLKSSDATINFLYFNATHVNGIGEDSTNQLLTDTDGNATFNKNNHEYAVASYESSNDAESYLIKFDNFRTQDSKNYTKLYYHSDGSWTEKKEVEQGDTVSLGSVELTIGQVNKDAKTVTFANSTTETNLNTLFSKEGLKFHLPQTTDSSVAGFINTSNYPTEWVLQAYEEDRNENVAGGDAFNATLGVNSDGDVSVKSFTSDSVQAEVGDTDKYRAFMYSELSTEFLHNRKADQRSLMITYHGEEAEANVFITDTSVGLSSSGDTGIKTAKDTETSMYTGKNMVVIGGSAINTVAADLLGGAYRGEKFTEMTGVAAGGFLIQSFDKGGKTALLVAGYNGADTSKAVDYLVNNEDKVDTAAGKKYTGTSATEAKLVVS